MSDFKVEDFTISEFRCNDIPSELFENDKKTGIRFLPHNVFRVDSLAFNIIKHKQSQTPNLIILMFHGWTSNKESMTDKTREILTVLESNLKDPERALMEIKTQFEIKKVALSHSYFINQQPKEPSTHAGTFLWNTHKDAEWWKQVWWVQVEAPYLFNENSDFIEDIYERFNLESDKANVQNSKKYKTSNIEDDTDDNETYVDEDTLVPFKKEKRYWWTINPAEFFEQVFHNKFQNISNISTDGLPGAMITVVVVANWLREQYPNATFATLGFSQGGGMALNATAIYYLNRLPLCSMIILSGLPANSKKLKQVANNWKTDYIFQSMPILHTHGTHDPTLFHEISEESKRLIVEDMKLTNYTKMEFQGFHEISTEVIQQILYHLRVNANNFNKKTKPVLIE